MKATAKDLRFHSKEILDAVSRGEEVVITYRGKPHAKIVPLKPDSVKENRASKAFGMWKDNKAVEDVGRYVREQRKGRFSC